MPPKGPYRTLEELDASLAASGVSAHDRRILLSLAKPAIALRSTAAEDGDIAVGASKIGGAPDLPRGMAWPTRLPTSQGKAIVSMLQRHDAEHPSDYYKREIGLKQPLANRTAPLAFMLQIDLAACAQAGRLDPDIPRDGRMLVFYDLVFHPWSGQDEDGNPLFQLLYLTESADELVRQPLPDLGYPLFDELDDYRDRLPPAGLTPVFTWTLPDRGSIPILTSDAGLGTDFPHEAWFYTGPTHLDANNRLGGWPENIQWDMALQLAARDAGVELKFGHPLMPGAKPLEPLAAQWVMLLQIGDYDNRINDFDGLYYVWIRREDLRARRFDKARLIYETS